MQPGIKSTRHTVNSPVTQSSPANLGKVAQTTDVWDS